MANEPINIYCDESTHLRNDGMGAMVLGAISCRESQVREAFSRMYDIRRQFSIHHDFEIKWTKVSPAEVDFYLALVDYFFDNDALSFRAVVAPKGNLRHSQFNQTHDDWYYKMMFLLVRNMLHPKTDTRIYLDRKDTRGALKARKLHEVVANSQLDFDRRYISRVQIVESHHVGLMQLADLLIGAVNYANRGLSSSNAKLTVVRRVQERSGGLALTRSTLPSEQKMNIFKWSPRLDG